MSITISTDVFCDSCGGWTDGPVAGCTQRAEARRSARKDGWVCGLGKSRNEDYCPECAKARGLTPTAKEGERGE